MSDQEIEFQKTTAPETSAPNPDRPSTATTQQPTQTITFAITPKPAPANKKLLELEKLTKKLIEELLAKLKSLNLQEEGLSKEKSKRHLLKHLKTQLEEIDKCRQELKSETLNEQEKNKCDFLDTCVTEFNKIPAEGDLGNVNALRQNLDRLTDKLKNNTYPQFSQNKDDPNLYSINHIELNQLQEAGKAACIEMGIDYQVRDNGFSLQMPADKHPEFQTLLMQKVYEKVLAGKQEKDAVQNQNNANHTTLTTKK
ncbi:MAG: hypothetical protein K0S11_185 [Gammaproteobacteria bacterium]|jgi:hypothetical protein|nr:hypothetical protein [Gammaproteobacteria bacterium]